MCIQLYTLSPSQFIIASRDGQTENVTHANNTVSIYGEIIMYLIGAEHKKQGVKNKKEQ